MKKAFAAIAFLFAAALFSVPAFAFGTGTDGCSGDCISCHKVTKQEAEGIMKGLDPTLSVDDVSPAPVRGLYQMVISKDKGKFIAYLDFSKRFLIQGSVLDLGQKQDLTRNAMVSILESQVVDIKKIPLKDTLLMGNPKGRENLYVFSDPECPFCAKLHEELKQLTKENPRLAIHIVLVPLDIHPNSAWKTEAIMKTAAKDPAKALAMLEKSYQNKPMEKTGEPGEHVAKAKQLANDLNITSTPTIIYANGKISLGAKKIEEIREGLQKNR